MSISRHLFDEMIKGMQGSNVVRDAIIRQESDAIEWIESSVINGGVDLTSEILQDLIAINSNYDGARPHFSELVGFALELNENQISRDSAKFSAQVRGSAMFGSMNSFHKIGDQIVESANPDYDASKIIGETDMTTAQEHPLLKSWNAVSERYRDAELIGDSAGMQSAERTLAHLARQIGNDPATSPATPQPASGTPLPTPAIEQEYDGSGQRDVHDELSERLNNLSDEDTPANRAELARIESAIDKLDAELDSDYGEDFADEDYG